MRVKNQKLLFACILGCELAGFIGTLFVLSSVSVWYSFLKKPPFSPPNWIFGVVWPILYALMGTSLYLIIMKVKKTREAKKAIVIFLIHLFLNSVWSIAFFANRNIGTSLAIIVVLWGMILYLIFAFRKIDQKAGLLLIPYFLWVSFAVILNYYIWKLN